MKVPRCLLSAIFSVWVMGCGDVSYDTQPVRYTGPTNVCTDKTDCQAGYICDNDLHICVREGGALHRPLYARIVPLHQEPLVIPLEYSTEDTKTVQYTAADKVSVQVLTADGDLAIASRILVTEPSGIPGTPPEIRYAAATGLTGDNEKNNVQFRLREGLHQYRIDALPSPGTKDYPPRYFDDVSVAENADDSGTQFVDSDGNPMPVLSLLKGTNSISGRILRGTQPAQGLSVEIVDPPTGRILSTQDVTGCPDGADETQVCGDFKVKTIEPMADTDFFLKIWNENDPAYPTVVLPREAATVVENNFFVFTLSFLSSPVNFQAWVERPVRIAASDVTLHDRTADCFVVFESHPDNDKMASVFLNAKTDASGEIVSLNGGPWMYLYPGDYRITIIPPGAGTRANEDYALYEETRHIDTSERTQVFRLKYRYFTSFRIQAAGKDIPGATVEAVPIDHTSPYASSRYSEPLADGSHKLWLDAGQYRLTVKVPAQSGYAYAFREIFVEPQGDTSNELVEIFLDDFQVPFPSVAKLQVQNFEGVNLSGATVEWYEQLGDGATVVAARSTLDSGGYTVGLLPPR